MKPRIIVMQTVEGALEECKWMLIKLGMRENIDFCLLSSQPSLESFVPDTRQIFVTGSFGGLDEGVAEMVEVAKNRNKELVAVSFSSHKIKGPFDYHIPKTNQRCWDHFQGVVRNFLDGTLNRTEVAQ